MAPWRVFVSQPFLDGAGIKKEEEEEEEAASGLFFSFCLRGGVLLVCCRRCKGNTTPAFSAPSHGDVLFVAKLLVTSLTP